MTNTLQAPTRETNLLQLFTTLLKHESTNAISETEPWGTLLGEGFKSNETRTWPPRVSGGSYYTGPLAIHLSKRMDDTICYRDPFSNALREAGYQPSAQNPKSNSWGLPLGHVIAIAWLSSVWQINEATASLLPKEGSNERTFGNYQTGRFVWTFSCVYKLISPIPVRGAQGIWKWTPPPQFWNEIQTQADQLRQIGKKERGENSNGR